MSSMNLVSSSGAGGGAQYYWCGSRLHWNIWTTTPTPALPTRPDKNYNNNPASIYVIATAPPVPMAIFRSKSPLPLLFYVPHGSYSRRLENIVISPPFCVYLLQCGMFPLHSCKKHWYEMSCVGKALHCTNPIKLCRYFFGGKNWD